MHQEAFELLFWHCKIRSSCVYNRVVCAQDNLSATEMYTAELNSPVGVINQVIPCYGHVRSKLINIVSAYSEHRN